MAYIDNVTNILQIQPDGLPTFVRLSQNENGRNLYFQLAGNEIDIPSNATVTISGTKPDGNVYSGTGSVTDNVVLIPEMLQMTAVAGTWDAKIKITSGGNTIATGRVRFIVDADTVDPDAVPSSSELEGLVAEAQQYAETARTEAYGSPLTASAAADMTDHTRVYVYTGSETGYTAGHWYYWDGTQWADGGIYNSVAVNTDTTLTLSGVAADAKATGDAIEAARVAIDDTLSNTGEAADAKVVGDELADLKSDLTQAVTDLEQEIADIEPGLNDEAKTALLACFEHVEWIDDNGLTYYNALESALNVIKYPCIKATFNANGHRFFPYDIVSSLINFVTVTYYETDESEGVTVPKNDVVLSGTLSTGISRITATYNNLSTSFVVPVEELVRNPDLPSDYEQVTYIYGNGTQYITTNLMSRLPMRVEARIRRGIGQPVIGAGNSSVSNSRFFLVAFQHDYIDGKDSRIATRISDDTPSQPSSTESGAVYNSWFYNRMVQIYQDVVYDVVSGVDSAENSRVNTYITVDGKTASIERKAPTTGYPFVFMKVPITSSIGKLYIYDIKFYSGDTLLFDGVPCYRKSDGNAGIYDTISGTFFGNSGTGEFLIGDVVE